MLLYFSRPMYNGGILVFFCFLPIGLDQAGHGGQSIPLCHLPIMVVLFTSFFIIRLKRSTWKESSRKGQVVTYLMSMTCLLCSRDGRLAFLEITTCFIPTTCLCLVVIVELTFLDGCAQQVVYMTMLLRVSLIDSARCSFFLVPHPTPPQRIKYK